MDENDALELYRMIKNLCAVIDVMLTCPSIDSYVTGPLLTDAGMDVLNEYASMRRYMLGSIGARVE